MSDLQQLRFTSDELEAIVARLNTQPKREIKKGHEPPQARAMKLVYHRDAAKGYKEAYVPVKRVGACCHIGSHDCCCASVGCVQIAHWKSCFDM